MTSSKGKIFAAMIMWNCDEANVLRLTEELYHIMVMHKMCLVLSELCVDTFAHSQRILSEDQFVVEEIPF